MKINTQTTTVNLLLCIALVVVMQRSHFAWYVDQPNQGVLLLSVIDWSIWCLMAGSYWRFALYRCNGTCLAKVVSIIFVLSAGIIHVFISSIVYQSFFTASNSFFVTWLQLLNQRWLQYLIIGLLIVLISYFKSKELISRRKLFPQKLGVNLLGVFDGKTHHRIAISEIVAICTCKNGISIITQNNDVIFNATLPDIKAEIATDGFIQVSCDALVNVNAICGGETNASQSYQLHLQNEMTIKVGERYLPQVKVILKI